MLEGRLYKDKYLKIEISESNKKLLCFNIDSSDTWKNYISPNFSAYINQVTFAKYL